jgi:hypothetical protein
MPVMSQTGAFALAMFLKPFMLFGFLVALLCVRFAVIRWFPEGRIKRFLLSPV